MSKPQIGQRWGFLHISPVQLPRQPVQTSGATCGHKRLPAPRAGRRTYLHATRVAQRPRYLCPQWALLWHCHCKNITVILALLV